MARILVSDDYAPLRELYRLSLQRHHHEVISAADGVQAWHCYLDHRPDLVLSDLHMPRMNGLDLVLALRRQGYRTPVILVSGGCTYVHGELQEVAILSKPVDDARLIRLVQAFT